MDILLNGLGILILLQSVFAFGAVIRFARYALRLQPLRPNRYQPKAVIIVPCKDLEHDFEENIRALFLQEYRDYEIIFVTESESDPAYAALSKLIKHCRRSAWMVVAGEAKGRGQKVHNLCAAIEMLNSIDRRAEVLVFADSDARPTRQWLAELVAPLGDTTIGATTGFRWYLPARAARWFGGRFATLLLSVWNASALSLLGERSGFAWGGSMAIRRENFEKLGIRRRWQGAVSDDYVLTAAIHEAGQRIKFIPQCLVASYADATLKELLEFTTRQIRITRVYSPRVWKIACITHCLYNFTFWAGMVWLVAGSYHGLINQTLAFLLIGIFVLGAISGWIRAGVAANLLRADRERAQQIWWAYALLGPAASLVYLYNVIASTRTRRIIWRGIGYEMISPSETLIWHRPAQLGSHESSSRSTRQSKASVRSSSQK
ncbi:MAG: glycosyltransferase family 2 protein [Acidobacteria bacterium]|nr:glycosyltransferase family 2 protein [Acidobacteriota bacterium]